MEGGEGAEEVATVLIPTMNNPAQLEVVLRRLLEDRDGSYSVLVIDSSKDRRTLELCNELGVRHLVDRSLTRADACNNGRSNETPEFTHFTDDDVIPPHGWVGNLIRWFEDEEVAGVGGPNFAPEDDPWLSKCTDVAFCAKVMTAGTRYGARPDGRLVKVNHNPGVNVAYRTSVLREVGGFDDGAIGAEDVLLDSKITKSGYSLFLDPTNVMPHRRRALLRPMMRQIRNYGYVRRLAINSDPTLRSPMHLFVEAFPLVALVGLLSMAYGAMMGGASLDLWFTLDGEWTLERALFHGSLGLTSLYLAMCVIGSAFGTSPHRSLSTVLASCISIPAAHLAYGWGMLRAEMGLLKGNISIKAIDDKER